MFLGERGIAQLKRMLISLRRDGVLNALPAAPNQGGPAQDKLKRHVAQ